MKKQKFKPNSSSFKNSVSLNLPFACNMKININFLLSIAFTFLLVLTQSCEKEERNYPFVIEYQDLSFSPTLWKVLTATSQVAIAEPSNMKGFDDSLKVLLLSDFALPPFRRLEFLSDSTVVVRFTDGNMFFDTIMPYQIYQGKTQISFGPSPEETVVFYDGIDPNTLELGVISTMHSYKKPNGVSDYSPLYVEYSADLNVFNIIAELRNNNNLMPNDTVAVNKAGYLFK